MMIFRSDDPAYVKRGETALRSRVSSQTNFADRLEPRSWLSSFPSHALRRTIIPDSFLENLFRVDISMQGLGKLEDNRSCEIFFSSI